MLTHMATLLSWASASGGNQCRLPAAWLSQFTYLGRCRRGFGIDPPLEQNRFRYDWLNSAFRCRNVIAGGPVISPKRILAWISLALSLTLVWRGGLAAEETRLGAGDVVRISVYGQNDLGTTARIGNGGEITFPLIGEVKIGGLSTREAENAIAGLLAQRNIVKDPQVTLFVEQRHSAERDSVTILGQVKLPGRFASETLSEGGAATIVGLLALAGGVSDSAADHLIVTRKEGGEQKKYDVDLVALLEDGDLAQNYSLIAGDVVFVPRMDVFYVYGEVHNPGRFRLERDMTVMQAIAVSGGLTPRASEKDLTLKRRNGDKIESRSVQLTEVLKPDDVLYVKEGIF